MSFFGFRPNDARRSGQGPVRYIHKHKKGAPSKTKSKVTNVQKPKSKGIDRKSREPKDRRNSSKKRTKKVRYSLPTAVSREIQTIKSDQGSLADFILEVADGTQDDSKILKRMYRKIKKLIQDQDEKAKQLREQIRLQVEDQVQEMAAMREGIRQDIRTLQNKLAQTQELCNWVYGTVLADSLPLYHSPSFESKTVGTMRRGQTILLVHKTVETPDGLWIQTRHPDTPTRLYWVLLCRPNESAERLIGNFRF